MGVSQKVKDMIPKETLEYLKNVEVKTRKEIGDIYGVNEQQIKKLLSIYGIKSVKQPRRTVKVKDTTKPITEYKLQTITKVKELEDRLLKETKFLDNVVDISNGHRYHYLLQGRTSIPKCICGSIVKADKEYADKVFTTFCSAECSSKHNKHTQDTYDSLYDIENLKNLRFNEEMSFEEMAKKLKTTAATIKRIFEYSGLSYERTPYNRGSKNYNLYIDRYRKSRGENTYGKELYDKLTNKEYLSGLWDSGMTFKEIAKSHKVGSWVISDLFSYLEIPYNPTRWLADGASVAEKEIREYVKSIYDGEVISSYRKEYTSYELDIFLPELNIGIEYNGCFYHSEIYKNSNYHKMKSDYWHEQGIRMVSIWEDDWTYHEDKTKAFIDNLLKMNFSRLGARKCKIVNLTHEEYFNFLENNHMLGGENSGIRIGLIYDNKIVSVMGFKKNKDGYNLTRFANTNVSGAFTKLLTHFIRQYSPSIITSHADLEIVDRNNNVYTKNGFIVDNIIKPDYMYFNRISGLLEHKFGWRKKKFYKLGYDIKGKSESMLADEANLLKCWDSGKIKYKLILDKETE